MSSMSTITTFGAPWTASHRTDRPGGGVDVEREPRAVCLAMMLLSRLGSSHEAVSGQRPFQTGFRFSAKALNPSRPSSEV